VEKERKSVKVTKKTLYCKAISEIMRNFAACNHLLEKATVL
jgi:hypothetical protein